MKQFIHNLSINTQDAYKRLVNSENNNKKIDNLGWWQLSQLQTDLETLKENINITDNFRDIYRKTDIRAISIEINGSGDSGGVDEINFYKFTDGKRELIKHQHNYVTGSVYLREYKVRSENSDELKTMYEWCSNVKHFYNKTFCLASYVNDYFNETPETQLTPTQFLDRVNGFIVDLNKAIEKNDAFKSEAIIHNINSSEKFFDFYVDVNETISIDSFPQGRYWSDRKHCHPLTLLYPQISRETWDNIEDHAIRQLDGGWEINEGSYNTVYYKLINADNELGFEVRCTVEQEQMEMITNEKENSYRYSPTHKNQIVEFLKTSHKIDTKDNITLDFLKKRDRAIIFDLYSYVKSLNGGK